MNPDRLEESVSKVLAESGIREDEPGKYHPSEISGCALQLLLDKTSNSTDPYNSWLLQGSAVHYYLQETGILDQMLYEGGYHPLHAHYEVHREYPLQDGVDITGTCDVLIKEGDHTTILDLKYSVLKPKYKHGRLMKYFSQLNIYGQMFGADELGLVIINSNESNLPRDGVHVMRAEPDMENWELMKEKIITLHKKMEMLGWEPGDEIWTVDELSNKDDEFWEDLLDDMDTDQMPAYEEECKHCSFSDFCPIKQNKLGSRFSAFKTG